MYLVQNVVFLPTQKFLFLGNPNHALIPNLSALLTSFSSFNVLFNSTVDKTSDFFIFLDGSTFSTTPNRSCLFLIFSSISAFFMTVADDWPNLSARFFKVSKSADGAAPILVLVRPNLSALDSFLASEVRSAFLLSSALAANLAARAAALSSSVHFLMVILSVDSDFFSTFAGVSAAAGASILAGLVAAGGLSRFITTFLAGVGAGTTTSSSSSPSSSLASSKRSVSLLGSLSSVPMANCNLSIKSCLFPLTARPLAFNAFFNSGTVMFDNSNSSPRSDIVVNTCG